MVFYCFDFSLQSLKLEVKTFLDELASYVFVLHIVLGICTTHETNFAYDNRKGDVAY
ncbi:hypothetical protein P5929_17625 [Bacillus cereus]|uniref:Uncharacterized protein n=2 Tax=Bacillus cereus TaxID=1396 RepID=B7III8_BACC2|nr:MULTISPECIES: hypothetical protein [Bacillus cereus group]ACK97682.1 conserved hypothetical protein [Bacillus cereus G9842]MDF9547550.1 hypothetical protein [Bacillus cereus]MDF9607856.1 hypothetical protein [Bacillus cereus]MDF9658944.1 hypothetical protein [Bacillus cereus]MDO6630791.1 hypothetical protein [Bacillus thuringiensis]